MKGWVLLTACALAPSLGVAAQPSSPAAANDSCLKLDNRVLGPRTSDRPLPLLSGDAIHGFHPACTVSWRALSPRNEALAVTGCFRGSLLQIANDSACGGGTGPLWVSTRWVMTSAELEKPAAHAATCQQLDTGAWAGTRAYEFDCVPQKKELNAAGAPVAQRAGSSAGAAGAAGAAALAGARTAADAHAAGAKDADAKAAVAAPANVTPATTTDTTPPR